MILVPLSCGLVLLGDLTQKDTSSSDEKLQLDLYAEQESSIVQ
jgi:hypothetical protein